MKGLKRTLSFVADATMDKDHSHPIIMRFAAKCAKVNHLDFYLITKPDSC